MAIAEPIFFDADATDVRPYMPKAGGPVHLWRVWLDRPDDACVDAMRAQLDGAEIARAERFQRALHRRRFIVCHSVLRRVLGRYLGVDPRQVEFAYGRRGKPRVAGAAVPEFSLAHSEDLAIIAVASSEVGVDVESLGRQIDAEAIARQFFSAEEASDVARAPSEMRNEVFLRMWTRKEAVLKALGLGLAGLASADAHACEVRELRPAPQFVGALAITRGI